MFGLRSENSTEAIKQYTRDINLPILILDPVWLSLFPKEQKNAKMIMLEERIKGLMKEEARLEDKKKKLVQVKKKHMSRIMQLSNLAHGKNNHKAKEEMQQMRRSVLEANKTYRQIEHRIEVISDEINHYNTQLLTETVLISYSLMKKSREKVDATQPKIEKLRKELFSLIEVKTDNEDLYFKTYNLLHKLVGKDVINTLDNNQFGRRNKRRWWV